MDSKKVAMGIISTSLRVIVLAIIIFVVYGMSLSAYDFGFRIFAEEPVTYGEGRDVEVVIPEGKGVLQIGEILQKNGLIKDSKVFFFQEMLSAYHDKMRPGIYTLNTSMTATEMMAVMAEEVSEEPEFAPVPEDGSSDS